MSVDPADRGLLLGDGLFETLLWSDGVLRRFNAHAGRMTRGCRTLGLPAPDPDEMRRAAMAAIERAGLAGARAAVRLTWTAGPGGRGLDRPATPSPMLLASAAPAPPAAGPAGLWTSAVRRNEGSPASRLKSLSYLDSVLARREAVAEGADEALMLNNRGEAACAAAANLFWFDEAGLVTPALDCGVLEGTTRTLVLAAARSLGLPAREARVLRPALAAAKGLFLTNALIGLRPVRRLDGRPAEPDGRFATLAETVRRIDEASPA